MLNQKKIKYYIIGDINIDILKYNLASNVTNYLNAIHSTGCNVFVDKPTRITSHSNSCIDHIYSNLPTNMLDNYIIGTEISDHFSTFTRINSLNTPSEPKVSYVRKSNLSEAEWQQVNVSLHESLRKNIPQPDNLNCHSLSQAISENYQEVIDEFLPERKVKENNNIPDKPWITSGFKCSIQKKWSLFKKWQKTKLPSDHLKYTTHLNLLTHLKKKAEIKYYADKAKLYGSDKSKTWQIVNEITNYKRKQKTSI